MGEHTVSFENSLLVLVQTFGGQEIIDRHAQNAHRLANAVNLGQGVIGNRVGNDHARLMQPDAAFGGAFLPCATAEHHGLLVQGLHAVPGKGPQLGHLGQHHGHNVQRVDLIFGKLPRHLGLHHQDAQLFAHPLDRHTKEAGVNLFPGFRHEPESLFGWRIGGVHGLTRARNPAHKPLAQLHAGLVHGLGL